MAYEVPPLPYAFDALEPHIDAATMEIHHDKHHQAYVDKANAALEGTEWADKSVEEVLKNLDSLPADKQKAVRNNARRSLQPLAVLGDALPGAAASPRASSPRRSTARSAPSTTSRRSSRTAGVNQFGSGWAWLVYDGSGLAITSTPNQDSPISAGQTPLLGADVWEHAYYLKYQNKRPDYLEAFWNVVNWGKVAELYSAAK